MLRETLVLTAIQSGVLFLALWAIFRLVPTIPANAKAWLWRLAFVKPLLSLMPFAIVNLPVLPAERPPVEIPASSVIVVDAVYAPAVSEASTPTLVLDEPTAPNPFDPILAMWCLGVAGVAIYAATGTWRAVRTAAQARPVEDEWLEGALDDLLARANVAHRPRLLVSDAVTSAMLVGGRQYAIILPKSLLDQGGHEDLRMMMAHEVAHIARQDLWWFSLASTVQSLFFFNPMVWVAARCSRLDHESATDRYAARLAGVPIRTYAEMLLRATVVARTRFAPGSLGVAESYRTLHRRLEAMKHFNAKPTFWRRTAIVALSLLTLSMLPAYNLVAAAWPPVSLTDEPIPATPTAPANSPKPPKSPAFAIPTVATVPQAAVRELPAPQAPQRPIEVRLRKLDAKIEKLKAKQARLKKQSGKDDKVVLKELQKLRSKQDELRKVREIRITDEGAYRVAIEESKNATAIAAKALEEAKIAVTQDRARAMEVVVDSRAIAAKAMSEAKAALAADEVRSKGLKDRFAAAEFAKERALAVQDIAVTRGRAINDSTARVITVDEDVTYEVTGKNVTITLKDGSYIITADGPVTIRPVKKATGRALNSKLFLREGKTSGTWKVEGKDIKWETVPSTNGFKWEVFRDGKPLKGTTNDKFRSYVPAQGYPQKGSNWTRFEVTPKFSGQGAIKSDIQTVYGAATNSGQTGRTEQVYLNGKPTTTTGFTFMNKVKRQPGQNTANEKFRGTFQGQYTTNGRVVSGTLNSRNGKDGSRYYINARVKGKAKKDAPKEPASNPITPGRKAVDPF